MITIDNPLLVLVGVPLMALTCWVMSQWRPLIETTPRAHAISYPLDGLRGVLACSVFFYHSYITYVFMRTGQWTTPQPNIYAQLGPTAVVLFFFISGYLFWTKMLKDPASIQPSRLWPNRFRRIFPAYWVAIGLAFVVAAVTTGFHMRQPATNFAYSTIQWTFVGFPCLPDINGLPQEQVTGGVFWTLRLELLFYLVLPALVWFRKARRLIWFIAIGVLVNRISHKLHSTEHIAGCVLDTLQRFTNALVTCFSVGMVTAYRPFSSRFRSALQSRWSTAIGLVLIAIQLLRVKAGYTGYEPILLAPLFFMIIEGNTFFGALTSRPMRCLGQISYSIYIFHGVILFALSSLLSRFTFVVAITPIAYWGLVLFSSMLVVILCTFTYLGLELPFLSRTTGSTHV